MDEKCQPGPGVGGGDAHRTQKGDFRELGMQAHMQFPELKLNRGSENKKAPLRTKAAFWKIPWESLSDRAKHKGRKAPIERGCVRNQTPNCGQLGS